MDSAGARSNSSSVALLLDGPKGRVAVRMAEVGNIFDGLKMGEKGKQPDCFFPELIDILTITMHFECN